MMNNIKRFPGNLFSVPFCSVLLFFVFTSCLQPSAETQQQKGIVKNTEKKSEKVIAVLPIGDFDTSLATFARKEIETFWTFQTMRMDPMPMPERAWYNPRKRWRADTLLNWLIEVKPARADYILGLTRQDISTTKDNIPDWGVFGLGYMPGPSCVVSTFRLKKPGISDSLFRERFSKVFLHELGHNFGLPHCPSKGCMMEDAAGTIRTVDAEKKQICGSCRKKLGIE